MIQKSHALPGHRPWKNTWWSYGMSISHVTSCVFIPNEMWWRVPLTKSLVVCDTPVTTQSVSVNHIRTLKLLTQDISLSRVNGTMI